MPRDYDVTLLESVSVRRRRLRDGLLWGRLRTRRAGTDGLARIAVGLVLTAVLSAGCVGWSFLATLLTERNNSLGHTSVTRLDVP